MTQTTDVAIIGGGAIGCSIAYQLSKLGIRCTIFERRSLACGASGATGGQVTPLWHIDRSVPANFEIGLRGINLFPAWSEEMADARLDPQFHQSGILKVARTDEQVQLLERGFAWQSELDLDVRWLDPDEARDQEPCVPPDTLAAVYSPREGYVVGKSFCAALANAAQRNGANLREGVEVTGLETDGESVIGVRTTDGVVHAGHTVVAAGPWTGLPDRWLPIELPVGPAKGLGLILRKQDQRPRSIILTYAGAMVPRPDDTFLVGAISREDRFDEEEVAGDITWVLNRAIDAFPAVADAEFVAARAGVRPRTPDGVPIIGPAPEWDGVTIAAGHGGTGIMQAPGTAELVAGYITTGDPEPLRPFSLGRFA